MTETEVRSIAKAAAEEALQGFLLVIGVNVATPGDKLELQQDFAHLRTERKAIGKIRDKVYTAIAGSVVTGIFAAAVFYVTHGH